MINEKNNHSWCVNAFHSMSGNNDGSTKMCCMIDEEYYRMALKDPILSMKENTDYFLDKKTIKENFNNVFAQKIRQNLEIGIRDRACNKCWQEEDGGRKSKRQRDNEKYKHLLQYGSQPFEGLAIFELNLGNTCNIKCRTCHPTISSQWMKEDYDLNHVTNMSFKQYSENMKKFHRTYDDESMFWIDLEKNLSTIRQFDFYGGEPFLSKKMWEILKICVDRGYADQIELHYNTNGTVWPKEVDLFKHFKSINLSFSIDGIGERFEYMRYGAKWNEVKKNMYLAKEYSRGFPKMEICWCITLSTLNIFYLEETLEEFRKNFTDFGLYLNLVHGPRHFNISGIPEPIKSKIIERLEVIDKTHYNAWNYLPGIIGFIKNGVPNRKLWNEFLEVVKKHDEYRQQDFFVIFSNFGKLINDSILE